MEARSGTGEADDSLVSVDDLDAAICRLASHLDVVGYRMLLLIREFDDRFGWAKWGFKNCAEWLSWRVGIGPSAAREKVRVAHALRSLPAISEAFEKGRLSYSKVRALTRVANASNEAEALDYALDATAAQVEEWSRELRDVRPEAAEIAREAWARRSLRVFRNPSRNAMTITVELPLDDGELVARAIEKAVRSVSVKGPEFDGCDGWHAQQADALVAMAKSYLAGKGTASADETEATDASEAGSGRADALPPDHYQLVVLVDESALRGGDGRSELPIETIRRLACDASVSVLTQDSRGNPLRLGRKHRVVSSALRRALWARDRGCAFPGCRHRLYVEGHHYVHWIDGGKTDIENTLLLCSQHHRLLHEGRYSIHRLADGRFEFRRPDGRVIPRCGYRADDAAPDPSLLEDHDCPSAEAWIARLLLAESRRRRAGWSAARPP